MEQIFFVDDQISKSSCTGRVGHIKNREIPLHLKKREIPLAEVVVDVVLKIGQG